MKPAVIYHSADFDGLFCREIARKSLGDDAEYIGWDYADEKEPQISPTRELFILDLSIPGLMKHPRLTWIDHHKTAIDRYPADIPGIRIDGVAACRLAWQWFFGAGMGSKRDFVERRVVEPRAVRLAGEYDVFDRRDPDVDIFQHGLRSRELDTLWPALLSLAARNECVVDDLLRDGRVLHYARTQENKSVIEKNGFTALFEGRTFLALNTARCNSLTFTAGLKAEHEGCLAFAWTGKQWRVSLYGAPSHPEIDFSRIAKKYGGGGHRQACGFTAKGMMMGATAAGDGTILSFSGGEPH